MRDARPRPNQALRLTRMSAFRDGIRLSGPGRWAASLGSRSQSGEELTLRHPRGAQHSRG